MQAAVMKSPSRKTLCTPVIAKRRDAIGWFPAASALKKLAGTVAMVPLSTNFIAFGLGVA